ncbi:MAG TPA: hypothetical protein HA254_01375 [Candidatus Diapherotrites archaeon]|uniref:DUF112 domain-containing protein n=1 Tax=Candidatus Iainarchaeum sp. TaxID=3101447 RepID=A0A7J4IYF7_9ARCH|nr:hypothetical protein [Candidatus Diapherotrites archaeon]
MIEEASWLFGGIIAGAISGIMPGIHANTVAVVAAYFQSGNSTGLAIFIVAMGITHSFVDAIPSIFLGAPTEEESLAILPGHELLLKGKGLEAVQITIAGGLATTLFAIPLLLPLFSLASKYSGFLPAILPAIIALTVILMVAGEKDKAAAMALGIISGILGVMVLGSSIKEPVLSLVSGFFALPGLILALRGKNKIPQQQQKIEGEFSVSSGFPSAVTSGVLALLPAIGPSQAATIVNTIAGKLSREQYLFFSGGINTGNLLFGLLMLFSTGKTRTGMAVALQNIVEMDLGMLLLLLGAALASAGIAALLTIFLAKKCIKLLQIIDYRIVSAITIIFLLGLVAFVCGPIGLLVMLIACSGALAGIFSKVKRSHCMAFLLLPTFLFYLGL